MKVPGRYQGQRVQDLRPYHIQEGIRAWYEGAGLWDRIIGCRSSSTPKVEQVSVRLRDGTQHNWRRLPSQLWDLVVLDPQMAKTVQKGVL